MEFITKNAEQTEDVGKKLASLLEEKNIKRAFIAMRGEMGVGKTAFTRGFAAHLEIMGVKSPTYTIVNEHRGRASLFHFDMYRIESEDDLISIGFDDYLMRDGYIIAEWSENVAEFIPKDAIYVTISRTATSPDERKITIDFS
jgi:tRNA threonylcarbamoyladenosine biosynthesis protein TsaE